MKNVLNRTALVRVDKMKNYAKIGLLTTFPLHQDAALVEESALYILIPTTFPTSSGSIFRLFKRKRWGSNYRYE